MGTLKIRICSIKQTFYDMFDDSIELEKNEKRPCLIILKLKYKDKKYDFAIPFRSNINGKASRKEFYPLPPRKTTHKHRRHGLHYIKMFPIKKEYINSYYKNNTENQADINKITKNIKTIIKEAQTYLTNYANGARYNYCVNIDRMIDILFIKENVQEQIEIKEIELENEKEIILRK